MKNTTKRQISAVLLLSVTVFGSCRDMSTADNVRAFTAASSPVRKTGADEQTRTPDGADAADEDDSAEPFRTTAPDGAEPEETESTELTLITARSTADPFSVPPKTPAAAVTTAPGTQKTTRTTAAPETTGATTTTTAAPVTAAPQTTPAMLPTETPPASQAPELAPVEGSYNVIGQNGILVSYQNGHYIGLMGCFGTYSLCESYTSAMNTFAAKLPDVNAYSMVIPTSSEFYTPEKLKSGFTASQFNKIEHVRQNLIGITNIDAYSALAAHTSEPIFARTDHHWLPLGAYYAAKEFAEAAGADFPGLDSYTPVTMGGYVGSMYTYSKDRHLYNDPEDFTMYLSPNADRISTTYYNTSFGGAYSSDLFVSRNASAYYCSFLGSDDRIAKITTDVKNGRTLVIFKESYGNALVPFLTSGFENIYVCDLRYFTPNAVQFCRDVGATDLLFAVCTFTAAGTNGNYLKRIISQ